MIYEWPFEHTFSRRSQIDFENVNRKKFSNFTEIPTYIALLKRGDILIVPPRWIHRVIAPDDSTVSINCFAHYEDLDIRAPTFDFKKEASTMYEKLHLYLLIVSTVILRSRNVCPVNFKDAVRAEVSELFNTRYFSMYLDESGMLEVNLTQDLLNAKLNGHCDTFFAKLDQTYLKNSTKSLSKASSQYIRDVVHWLNENESTKSMKLWNWIEVITSFTLRSLKSDISASVDQLLYSCFVVNK